MRFFNLNSKNNYNKKSLKNKIGLNISVVFSFLLLFVAFNVFSFLNSFFLGVFGLSTYIIFVALIAIGAMMYLDKEIVVSKKEVILLFSWLFVLGCILHLSTTLGFINESYAKYLQTTYAVKTTFGGVVFSLFVYLINMFTHTIASYVLYSVALISISAAIAQIIYERVKGEGQSLIRSSQIKRAHSKPKPAINEQLSSVSPQVKSEQDSKQNTVSADVLTNNSIQTHGSISHNRNIEKDKDNELFVSDEEFADDFTDTNEELEKQRKAEIMLGLVKGKDVNDLNFKNKLGSKARSEIKTTASKNLSSNENRTGNRPRKFVHNIISSPQNKQPIAETGKELSETDKKNLDFLRKTTGKLRKKQYEFDEENVLKESQQQDYDSDDIVEVNENPSGFELDDYLTSEIFNSGSGTVSQAGASKRQAIFSENNELIVGETSFSENEYDLNKPNANATTQFSVDEVGLNSKATAKAQSGNVATTKKHSFKRKVKYVKPPLELLDDYEQDYSDTSSDHEEKAKMLEETLASFKINATVVSVTRGPSVTRFELQMPHGISVKRVTSYVDDIAMVLESHGAIRVEIPIPGKNAFGVEVPNEKISTVGLKDVIESYSFEGSKSKLTFALGKDITGESKVARLDKMPHLLVAGSTGSGKSVCLNSMLISLIYKTSPEDLKLILIDPKRVEFALYNGLPHMLVPKVITDPEKAVMALSWLVDEMERRFTKFSKNKVRNLEEYNISQNVVAGLEKKLPYIVLVVDELADLMMLNKKEIEEKIIRIAQKSRAAGIHLVIATQRPSVDVITGLIKANLPSRIAFAVSSFVDSKTILDQAGAENLLGKGDMLYSPIDMSDSIRIQGAFVSNTEVEKIIEFVKENNEANFDEEIEEEMFTKKQHGFNAGSGNEDEFDPLFKDAVRLVIKRGNVSISMVQRAFAIGFNRAGRIVDQMEIAGFVSPPDNSRARELYATQQEFEERFGEDL